MNIYLEFKPYSLSDGIILYEGNNRDGSGDFMAILQKDGYLEFRFDTGSGKYNNMNTGERLHCMKTYMQYTVFFQLLKKLPS